MAEHRPKILADEDKATNLFLICRRAKIPQASGLRPFSSHIVCFERDRVTLKAICY